jgi:signal transduction histidine kinase
VSIQDQGMGIVPEELPLLFERFQRGEQAEYLRIQGTGLGLALCKEIIRAHNGRIWAESAGEGQGATFSFALPAGLPVEPPGLNVSDSSVGLGYEG